MSVFRVKSPVCRLTTIVVAGLLLVSPLVSMAQTGSAAPQSTGPRSLLPPGVGANAAPRPDRSAGEGTSGGILIRQLDAPGESAAGLLVASSGGLGVDLWRGSQAGVVHALYGRMPDTYTSPAARDLARRVLLSVGTPPAGSDGAALLGQRMTHLVTMGEVGSAIALAAASGDIGDPAFSRPLVDALLLNGDVARACDQVSVQVRGGSRDFWQRASVFCDLQAGRRPDADLTRTILNETGRSTALFDELADAVADGISVTLDNASAFGPLELAMFRAAPKAALKEIGRPAPAVAAQLATLPRLTTPQRLDAGEIANRAGTLPTAAVSLILGAPDADLSAGPLRKAAVSVSNASGIAERAEALLVLWDAAVAQGDASLAAAMAAPALANMIPSADIGFLAPVAFRMHLLNGADERALGWLELLRRRATAGEGGAIRAQIAALPLAQVSALDPVNDRRLGNWRAANPDGAVADRQWRRILLLMDAVGSPVSETLWTDALKAAPETGPDAPRIADAALWRQLVMASGAGRTGEAAQAALALVGSAGPGALDPVTLATVVGSLRRAGQAATARRLAVEALIATENAAGAGLSAGD
ncbi:MAG: hypothetical protein P1U65_16740 [Minwuia sp.]|nr:hypothetical protein [Minwuia sp.]